jgi:hypothetical protein
VKTQRLVSRLLAKLTAAAPALERSPEVRAGRFAGVVFLAVLFISSVDVMQNCEGSLSRDRCGSSWSRCCGGTPTPPRRARAGRGEEGRRRAVGLAEGGTAISKEKCDSNDSEISSYVDP